MHCKYLLYAHPNSYVFTLKRDGAHWLKEFTSIFDAVAYSGSLPGSADATVTVFDSAGSRLAELRVQDDPLAMT